MSKQEVKELQKAFASLHSKMFNDKVDALIAKIHKLSIPKSNMKSYTYYKLIDDLASATFKLKEIKKKQSEMWKAYRKWKYDDENGE